MSKKPKDNTKPGSHWRKRIVIPPWAWLLLQVIATVGWLLAIAWGTIYVASWLFS